MAPRYDYKIAMATMNEADKNRLIACYLSMDNPNSLTDWDVATTSFGAASAESMRVMVRTALKKVKDAGGLEGTPATEEKTPKKGGRKRKTEIGNEESPAPKSAKKKQAKKVKSEEAVPDEDAADVVEENINVTTGAVKNEDDGSD